MMNDWFTIDQIDKETYIISEYRHWEETHCYLLNGSERSLLIDTGLGISDIHEQVIKLTDKPIVAVATHIHWDHIGGHKYFPDFYAHKNELNWLGGEFSLTMEQIKGMVVDRCDLPEGYDVNKYEFFQGKPTKALKDNEIIDIGDRFVQIVHTPGHSPGHMCFWEKERGYIFTGDLVYKDTLFAYFPSTDPEAYLNSLERVSALPVKQVFPAHHTLNIKPEILFRMRDAFRQLQADGKLHHGSGTYDYGDWAIWL
ncbi:MBL fold metallo-hydrolase [Desulfococcaceae bacterium HSG7]|nr:MBL fold metallo-hydrolase [Desulfococcaceae bacterium HSG7]